MNQKQEPDHFFSFENHHQTVFENITKYWNKGAFLDVTLICSGHTIRAHRIILSACSPLFESMLSGQSYPNPTICFMDISKQEMELLLEFMYTGNIKVPQNLVSNLLKVAQKLQIKDLNDVTSRVASDSQNNSKHPAENIVTPNLSSTLTETNGQNLVVQAANENTLMTVSPFNRSAFNCSPIQAESCRQNLMCDETVYPIIGLIKEETNNQNLTNAELVLDNTLAEPSRINKDTAVWLTSNHNSNKGVDQGKKVPNPFAKKVKRLNDSDSTQCDFDPCASGPSRCFENEPTIVPSATNDSDIEFIDNKSSVVVIADRELSTTPEIHRKVQKRTRIPRTVEQLETSDYTSDDSELLSGNISNKRPIRKCIADDSDTDSSVTTMNSVSAKTKNKIDGTDSPMKKKKKDPNKSKDASLAEVIPISSTSRNHDHCEPAPDQNKEPIEGFIRKSHQQLGNVCILCYKYTKNMRHHYQKYHLEPRRKPFHCKICSRKFIHSGFLEYHVCQ